MSNWVCNWIDLNIELRINPHRIFNIFERTFYLNLTIQSTSKTMVEAEYRLLKTSSFITEKQLRFMPKQIRIVVKLNWNLYCSFGKSSRKTLGIPECLSDHWKVISKKSVIRFNPNDAFKNKFSIFLMPDSNNCSHYGINYQVVPHVDKIQSPGFSLIQYIV